MKISADRLERDGWFSHHVAAFRAEFGAEAVEVTAAVLTRMRALGLRIYWLERYIPLRAQAEYEAAEHAAEIAYWGAEDASWRECARVRAADAALLAALADAPEGQ